MHIENQGVLLLPYRTYKQRDSPARFPPFSQTPLTRQDPHGHLTSYQISQPRRKRDLLPAHH